MTNQELYTTVRTHLLKQKARSMTTILGAEMCAYRGRDGMKCAIGCLITDAKYSRGLEGHDVSATNVILAADIEATQTLTTSDRFYGEQVDLARRLQGIHDVFQPDGWEHALNQVARDYNFTVEYPL